MPSYSKNSVFNLVLLTSIISSTSWAESVLTIGTFNHYPYHYSKAGVVKGDAVEIIECIMNALHRKFKLTVYPQARGIQLIKSGKLDGLLSYQSFQEEFLRSVASNPIVFERWNSYYHFDDEIDTNTTGKGLLSTSRLGSVRGGSIETWLLKNQLIPHHRVSNFDQLLKMLHQRRIDAFVADERSTGETINEAFQGHDFSFEQKFITFSPLSIHFSQDKYGSGDFLKRFNSHISSCRPKPLELKFNEGKLILEKAKAIFDEYLNSDIIRSKVLKSNLTFHRTPNENTIAQLEKQWKNQKLAGEGPLVNGVIQSEESKILRKIMRNTEGTILEIIVMNKFGFNVASTGTTSDYYQGDEDKYRKTYLAGPNSTHLGNVEFDDSSNNFGAQVSFTLSNNGVKIGAVTLTIDVYKVFL